MMMRRSVLILPLLLAGCGFLSSKPSTFYSLDRIPPQAAITTVRGLPIGVDVVLPPGLNRKEVVARQANHQLEIRGREQWTALLQPLVLHTLAFDLAGRLPEGMVILPGQVKPDGAMRSLDVVVEELAAGPEHSVVLDARWTIHEAGRPDLAGREHIVADIAGLDSTNIATGTSNAIATLADHIVGQLK
ncbi:MAG: uncharacterized protein QOC81_3246 [Thermoanaerobaculia bacterium]|jgi:uncharacterized lipoprotein YmbA|nr:uncharacterized protein [Thermoanaerobaculia bacterium]